MEKKTRIFRERQHELRREVLMLLGGCSKCGNNDIRVLQIHHTFGNGSKHRKEFGNSLYYLRSVKKEIVNGSDEYTILCANCHAIEHYIEQFKHPIKDKITEFGYIQNKELKGISIA